MAAESAPQVTAIRAIHRLGPTLCMIRLPGTSRKA
ncbi:hypothetical protein SHIRM173S_08755 [Streptomyces hirsutus]